MCNIFVTLYGTIRIHRYSDGLQCICIYNYARGCVSGRMEAEEGETLSCGRIDQIVHACMLRPFGGVSLPLGTGEVSWRCRSL